MQLFYFHRRGQRDEIAASTKFVLFNSRGIDLCLPIFSPANEEFRNERSRLTRRRHASPAKRQLYKNNIDPGILERLASSRGSQGSEDSSNTHAVSIAKIPLISYDHTETLPCFCFTENRSSCDFSCIGKIHGHLDSFFFLCVTLRSVLCAAWNSWDQNFTVCWCSLLDAFSIVFF